MGEADVRSAAEHVVAALAAAGRARDTIRRHQVVLDRFAMFVAERGTAPVSDQVCLDFIADQTGVRLGSLEEPAGDKAVQAVLRPVVLMADALAGRAVDAGRRVVPLKDGCPAKFRPLPRQGGEHSTISPVGLRAGDLPAQYRDLVPEDQDLRVLGTAQGLSAPPAGRNSASGAVRGHYQQQPAANP